MYPEQLLIGEFPTWLSNALGVSMLTSHVISIFLIFLMIFIPMMLIRIVGYVLMICTILLMVVVTTLGWLPTYTWIFIAIYLAYKVSGIMKGWF
jgi:hypothetical protein